MKKFALILLLACFIISFANEGVQGKTGSQNSGVKFEDLSLIETLAKAVKENKLVMIDVYSHG